MSSSPSPHSFMSFPTPIPRAPRSSSSPNTPSRLSLSTSRPKSAELPQFLNSYLSAVFDVDWSVGLPSTEDSLFIQKSSLSSSPPIVTSSLSSPKRISDSSASVSSFSSRSSTASLSSSMTSVEGGSQKSVEELSLSKGKLWDENGSIPIPLLSKPTPPLDANTSSNKSIHIGKSILVKKSQPNQANGNSTSNGTIPKGFLKKDDGGIKKKSSPPLPPVPTLKIQNNKPKATLVPGRRSSLMQTGQLPAVSSPNTKGSLLAATSTSAGIPPTIEVTAPVSVLSFPTVPSTISFPVGNTSESAANTSQASPKFARRTSSLTSERTGYQNRKASSSENLIAPSNGLPRPLGASGFPVSAILTASQSSGGTTAIALSNFPSVPTGLPQPSYGATPDGNLGGRTAKAGWSPSEQPQEQFVKQKTYNSYVIQTAPITMPTSTVLPYSEPAGFPPSRSRSPPQAPRQLAIVSSAGNVHSSQLPPSSSSPSRSQSSAPTLPLLFPVPPQDQSYGSKPYSSSPISLHGHRQEQYQKSQQQYLLPPYTFARSVSDDELQSRSYNASSTLSPPMDTRPAASYSIKTSRSSPDLMSSSDILSYNNSGGSPPLPNAPSQYHNQHPQGQAYQYPGSSSRTTSVRKPIASFVSAPLPQIPSFKDQVNSSGREERRNIHHGHGYGSKGSPSVASARWNSMKSMLGLKSGSGKA
ncbi:MAG: hypothetical protein BYD32DRAFT_18975 [Podila humilis]|nr:MAG: hypothetical protein BYD32DRAFT_18975 [Podila humilis]